MLFTCSPSPCHLLLQGGLSKLSYEESKFLGGDIAHTHLVKGLDFALLQKVGLGVYAHNNSSAIKAQAGGREAAA